MPRGEYKINLNRPFTTRTHKKIKEFLGVKTPDELRKKYGLTKGNKKNQLQKAYEMGAKEFNDSIDQKKTYILSYSISLGMVNTHYDNHKFSTQDYNITFETNKHDEARDIKKYEQAKIDEIINKYANPEMSNLQQARQMTNREDKNDDLFSRMNSTTKIRTMKSPIQDHRARMRDVRALDGYGDQQWNTNKRQCVIDYLRATYTGQDGFKNKNGKYLLSDEFFKKVNCYANMRGNEIFLRLFGEKQESGTVKGVDREKIIKEIMQEEVEKYKYDGSFTMLSLYAWCICCNIPHYALDSNENVVSFLRYARDKNCNKGRVKPIVYQYKNNHFNPVENPDKFLTICKIGNSSNNNKNVVSETIEEKVYEENSDIECKYVEGLIDNLPQIIKDSKRDIQNRSVKLIQNTQGQIYLKSILFREKKQRIINMDDEMKKYKTYCDKYNIEFNGMSLSTIGNEILGDIPKSNMNPLVYQQFNVKGIADRAHLGCCVKRNEFDDLFKNTNIITADINKHYTAVFKKSYQDYAMIDFKDDFKEYNGEAITTGYYYIETKDMKLFHGSNIYSHGIVQLGLNEGLITEENIIQVLECKRSLRKNYFEKFVNEVYETYGKECEYEGKKINIAKQIVNRAVGCLNKTSSSSFSNVGFTSSTDELLNKLKTDNRPYLKSFNIEGKEYYLYGNKHEVIQTSNNRPLWITVLDNANIMLYLTSKKIGGTTIYRKTDALVISNPVNVKPSEKIGGYKIEGLPKNMFDENGNVKMQRERKLNFCGERAMHTLDVKTSNEMDKIIEFVKNNSLLIIGRAGVGKTYIAKKLIDEFKISIKLAFTNKACINISGSTLHSFLKMKDNKICATWARKITADYIIIDEVSMLNSKHWQLLCNLKILTGAKFILLGDYRQCPSIEDEQQEMTNKTITDFKYKTAINFLCDYNKVEFTEYNPNARYDKELWNVSQELFEGNEKNIEKIKVKFDEKKILDGTNICYLNSTRKAINELANNKKKKTANAVFIPYVGNDDNQQDVFLYEGLPIIFNKTIRNKEKERLFMKNQTATIDKIDGNLFYVGEHSFELSKFHDIAIMGYATTVYKSQGDTIKGKINIFDWKHFFMNGNLKYTAITRGTCLSNISIVDTPKYLKYKEQEGFIYMIECKESGRCYVGSCRDYAKRREQHESPLNECTSKSIIEKGNYEFKILMSYDEIGNKSLLKKEQQYIEIHSERCVNKKRAIKL